jgi:hypothetical protein
MPAIPDQKPILDYATPKRRRRRRRWFGKASLHLLTQLTQSLDRLIEGGYRMTPKLSSMISSGVEDIADPGKLRFF